LFVLLNLEKAFHREGRQGREGKQSTSLIIKITNLVISSGFTLALISLASLAVQMLDLGWGIWSSFRLACAAVKQEVAMQP